MFGFICLYNFYYGKLNWIYPFLFDLYSVHFWNYHYLLVVPYNRHYKDVKYPLHCTLPPSDTPDGTSLNNKYT